MKTSDSEGVTPRPISLISHSMPAARYVAKFDDFFFAHLLHRVMVRRPDLIKRGWLKIINNKRISESSPRQIFSRII